MTRSEHSKRGAAAARPQRKRAASKRLRDPEAAEEARPAKRRAARKEHAESGNHHSDLMALADATLRLPGHSPQCRQTPQEQSPQHADASASAQLDR